MQLWTDIWLLRFHPQKCHALTIGVRKTNLVEYSLPDGKGGGRIALNQVNSEKDIGVIIDSNLTFREHMTENFNKANRVMGVIRRTYTYLDESTFLSLYKALVRPLLEYANHDIWCNCRSIWRNKSCGWLSDATEWSRWTNIMGRFMANALSPE